MPKLCGMTARMWCAGKSPYTFNQRCVPDVSNQLRTSAVLKGWQEVYMISSYAVTK